MKISKLIWVSFALFVGLTSARAQDEKTMILKNGSELTGYSSLERPGESMTFTTSKAIVVLPKDTIMSIIDKSVKYSQLSEEWKRWADENNAYTGTGNNKTLSMSEIITKGGAVNNVRILEKGERIKYLQLSPGSYSIKWDQISAIKVEPRDRLLLSGLNKRYKLLSGMEYEGEYLEAIPNKTISLRTSTGVIEVFNSDDVVKDIVVKVNPDQSLFEQSGLLDIVSMKDGSMYTGIIFEKNYALVSEKAQDYLLIQLKGGSTMSLKLDDIVEYRKERNPEYNPLTDIELEDVEGAINRFITKCRKLKEVSNIFTIDSIASDINLELKNSMNITAEFRMEQDKAQQLKLLKVHNYKDKKNKKVTYHGFSYEDIIKRAVLPVSVTTSVNGISKVEFNLQNAQAGTYCIYDPIGNRVAIFNVTTDISKVATPNNKPQPYKPHRTIN